MRKSFAVLLVVTALAVSAPLAQAQGALSSIAPGVDRGPASDFSVQLRNANTGELSASTRTHQAGQFSFASLRPGNHVVEIADAAGRVVGLSPSVSITAGAVVTVTVGATAAGALAASEGGRPSLLDLGPLASVAVAGDASGQPVAAVMATGTGKLIVCHTLSATRSLTLQINESAREGHVGHGDTLGACAVNPTR